MAGLGREIADRVVALVDEMTLMEMSVGGGFTA